jgi:membrane-associated phospholipid phosphatase
VSAGRPPWWLVAASALVTGAVSVELLAGAWLGRVDDRVSAVVGGWDLRHGAAYPLFWLASQLGGRVTILVVIAGLVGHLAWRRHAVLPLLRVLLALALLTATVYAFKLGMGRTAPAYPGSYFHRGGESFPSGHVANAVLMWGVARWLAVDFELAAPVQRLFRWLSLAGPVVAGAAMLVLDFHWLSDVVVGGAVGIVLLGVVHALDELVLFRWARARAGRGSA